MSLRLVLCRVDDWFLGKGSLHAMVICRIAFGLILVFCYLSRIQDFHVLYSPQGIGGGAFMSQFPGSLPFWRLHGTKALPGPMYVDPWPFLYLIHSYYWVVFLYTLLIVSSLFFALGYKTRVSGFLALFLHWLFHDRSPFAYWGWGIMMKPYMLYIVLSPAGHWFSVDSWINRKRLSKFSHESPAYEGSLWTLRLLQLHIATMYARAGWNRMNQIGWQRGDMLLGALVSQYFGKFEITWQNYPSILEILSHVAFGLEFLAPFALWFTPVSPYWALGLMGMHAGIELTTNLDWWSPLMIAALTAFIPRSWFGKIKLPGSH